MFPDDVKFLEDPVVKEKLATAKKLSEVSHEAYDAIFYVGGHGPVIDLASDPVNIKLASSVSTCGFARDGMGANAHVCSSSRRARLPRLCATAPPRLSVRPTRTA